LAHSFFWVYWCAIFIGRPLVGGVGALVASNSYLGVKVLQKVALLRHLRQNWRWKKKKTR